MKVLKVLTTYGTVIDYLMILSERSERSDRSLIVSGYEVKSCPIPVLSVRVAGLLLILIGRTEFVNTDVVTCSLRGNYVFGQLCANTCPT